MDEYDRPRAITQGAKSQIGPRLCVFRLLRVV